jgi:hypothetical protein
VPITATEACVLVLYCHPYVIQHKTYNMGEVLKTFTQACVVHTYLTFSLTTFIQVKNTGFCGVVQ